MWDCKPPLLIKIYDLHMNKYEVPITVVSLIRGWTTDTKEVVTISANARIQTIVCFESVYVHCRFTWSAMEYKFSVCVDVMLSQIKSRVIFERAQMARNNSHINMVCMDMRK